LLALVLWRRTAAAAQRARLLLIAAVPVGFAAAATVIYFALGAHQPAAMPATVPATAAAAPAASPAAAKSMQAEIAGLETRLARGGGSDADWTLLAQAYDYLGRPEDARQARAHIVTQKAPPLSNMSAADLAAAAAAAQGAPAGPPAAAAAAAPAPAAAGDAATSAPSAAELEQRVGNNPRDAQSWLALADLRRLQRDYGGARTAYAHVADLGAMSAQSWADYADALGSLAGGSLSGEAAAAIDKALTLDPNNVKALWLKASQAHEQHHFAEALSWWRKLRAALPAGSPDAAVIDANIAEDTALAGTGPAAAPAANPAAEISGTVTLDARFANRVQPQATLFVYAKAVDSPGPPLAVWRTTTGSWPVAFRLDDSMAMIPSRRLSQFDQVVVEARISRSGLATPASGDLYATSPVARPLTGPKLALVIDREVR
jgi:cytochrome c-type biogenesis protein CcmH